MLVFAILLIIVGFLAAVFGILQNTILFNLFADLNARLERANLETDFSVAWIFDGPGTTVLIIGFLIVAAGITLIVIRRMQNKMLRQINKNIKHTNKKRTKKGKRVPKR